MSLTAYVCMYPLCIVESRLTLFQLFIVHLLRQSIEVELKVKQPISHCGVHTYTYMSRHIRQTNTMRRMTSAVAFLYMHLVLSLLELFFR